MTYAIIKVAGKQYRVREGERLLVDRLAEDDGATFSPAVLLVGGSDDGPVLDAGSVTVTAKVLGAVKGPKIRIGKYKKRTGYRRHTGFRASLTQIEIESIGGKRRATKKAEEPAEKPAAKQVARGRGAARRQPSARGGGAGQGHARRLRAPHGRGHQGGVDQLEPAHAGGGARVRAGAREPEGRDRRDRGGARGEGE